MHLTGSSFSRGYYAIVREEYARTDDRVIEDGVPCHRLSGYHTPLELLIWLDGYHAGMQK